MRGWFTFTWFNCSHICMNIRFVYKWNVSIFSSIFKHASYFRSRQQIFLLFKVRGINAPCFNRIFYRCLYTIWYTCTELLLPWDLLCYLPYEIKYPPRYGSITDFEDKEMLQFSSEVMWMLSACNSGGHFSIDCNCLHNTKMRDNWIMFPHKFPYLM